MSNEATKIQEEAEEWLQGIVLKNTPKWAHMLAFFAQQPGLGFCRFLIPAARKVTQITIKTENIMNRPEKGFRQGTSLLTRRFRVFKKGRMIATKDFGPEVITNSPYSRIV